MTTATQTAAKPSGKAGNRIIVQAGAPSANPWLYHRAPFHCGDAAVFFDIPGEGTTLILRDIERDRAVRAKVADHIFIPKEFTPDGGLSGDRDTATAQAAAEFAVQRGITEVWSGRSLPLIFAHFFRERGVEVRCDPEIGVLERRSKSEREVDALRKAQRQTEGAIRFACEMIANAETGKGGALLVGGEPLTSERVQNEINMWLLRHGMGTSGSIVAGGPQGADCHNRGSGPLRTGEPIIVDIFPMDPSSHYFGDCTRTVVHGEIPPVVQRIHDAAAQAKKAATERARPGVSGEDVHKAACEVFTELGYGIGLPVTPGDDSFRYVHGTGHGVGLDVHEPPLLDFGGPPLVVGDCLTIEPGLYGAKVGGVRIEDMVIVREDGCENLNTLPETLRWK
ncbi:MAG: aminopeptidase P family protein [Phycisphaeraceae bacterium]|nr:aminopeptidase P family protein [Phycisphaeraceae bacterium]